MMLKRIMVEVRDQRIAAGSLLLGWGSVSKMRGTAMRSKRL